MTKLHTLEMQGLPRVDVEDILADFSELMRITVGSFHKQYCRIYDPILS